MLNVGTYIQQSFELLIQLKALHSLHNILKDIKSAPHWRSKLQASERSASTQVHKIKQFNVVSWQEHLQHSLTTGHNSESSITGSAVTTFCSDSDCRSLPEFAFPNRTANGDKFWNAPRGRIASLSGNNAHLSACRSH